MKNYFILMLLLLAALLSGCQQEKALEEKEEPVAIVKNINVDNYFVKGPNEQVFYEIPKNVFVIGENETETLLELGVADRIGLTTKQGLRPFDLKGRNWEAFQTIPKCQSANVNVEYLTKFKPDLIVCQQYFFTRDSLNSTDYWNRKGVHTMIPINTNSPGKHLQVETVAKEMQFIKDLGTIFHKEDKAQTIIDETYDTIAEVEEKTKGLSKPKVMIVEFISAMISYDRTKLVGNMVELLGGQVAETPPVVGYENLIKLDPDVLIVVCSHWEFGACSKKITEHPALRKLKCVKNKRVYSIPLRYTYGTACRTSDGLKILAEDMYPEVEFSFSPELVELRKSFIYEK